MTNTAQELADAIAQVNAAITTLDDIISWKSDPAQRAAFEDRRAVYVAARRTLNADLTAAMRAN